MNLSVRFKTGLRKSVLTWGAKFEKIFKALKAK